MFFSRRRFLKSVLGSSALGLASCSSKVAPSRGPRQLEIVERTEAFTAYVLLSQQSDDGGFRSKVYGPFKDGLSLTPLVLRTMLTSHGGRDVHTGCRKGAAYLASFVQPDGTLAAGPHGIPYPVYTSAGAVWVLSQPVNAEHSKARDAWLAYLRQQQLTEEMGWQPDDKPYGGWGYSPRLPRKPRPGEPLLPLTESNLSATLFALEALDSAGVRENDPAFRKALVFVQRCQNYQADALRETAFDDGGFFFIYDDPVRNKAGVVGKDRTGRERFASYGSTTADGLRALRLCGAQPDDPRLIAARAWLEANFRADRHPGNYSIDQEHNRNAVYYYYCSSVAQALLDIDPVHLQTPQGKVRWAEVLADELIERQRPDGSWCNPLVPQREDDPLVATSWAALALARCRESLREG